MKKKIFSFLIVLTMFFGFGFTAVEAQAEFIDDNIFVVSNADFDINEQDVKELFLFFADYVETYDLEVFGDEIDGYYYDISNNLYGGLNIDFQADLTSLDFSLSFSNDDDNVMELAMLDFNDEVIFAVHWITTDDPAIMGIATYDFNVVITLFEEETIEEEGISIFGFFKNFYSNYIFPNNLLDTQTLNLITAVTTLLFFIGVFRGIYSIFFRNKRK